MVPAYKNVPALLTALPNFVVWRSEKRNGKPTKVPYDAKRPGQMAKSNDPATWSTFAQAVDTAADPLKDLDGIGFMLQGTNLVGVDFDGVIQNGAVEPYVLEILKHLGNPYCEVTPSTTGLRVFIECAALPKGNRKFSATRKGIDKYGIEIYSGAEGGRYLTITGDRFSGDGIPQTASLALPYFLISQFPNAKFKRLWMADPSDHEGDQSRADLALAGMLARLFDYDREKVLAVFNASIPGHREKWVNRPDYQKLTLDKVMEGHASKADISVAPPKGTAPEAVRQPLVFHKDVVAGASYDYVTAMIGVQTPREFEGWFPLGSPSLVGGSSGAGKSTFMLDLCVKQAVSAPVFSHSTFGYPWLVLMVDRGQKSHDRTLRRMGFVTNDVPIRFLPAVLDSKASQAVIDSVEAMEPTPKVVFIEGLDMLVKDANKMDVVMPFMNEMQAIAEHFHCALIGSIGAPKMKAGEGYVAKRDTVFGSSVWARQCETIITIQFPQGDDTALFRDVTVMLRNGKTERLRLEFQNGRLEQVPLLDVEEKPDEVMGEKLQEAISFIEGFLQDGQKYSYVVMDAAVMEQNIKKSTLLDAARWLKDKKHLIMHHKGGKKWLWELTHMAAVGAEVPEATDDCNLFTDDHISSTDFEVS